MTRATYDAIANQWTTSERDSLFWQPELDRFKQLLPSGQILEVGAADGRYAPYFRAAGYEYVGVDVSPELVKIAQRDYPQETFKVQSVYDLQPEQGYDGFWVAAVLLHLPKTRVDQALQRIHHVVRKGGVGMISLRKGSGEGMRTKKRSDGTQDSHYFAYYEPDEFYAILERNNFEILDMLTHPEGSKYTWLSFFVRTV